LYQQFLNNSIFLLLTGSFSVPRQQMVRPIIAITMGDPAGVGPEICLRALSDTETCRLCVPVVFGDLSVLRHVSTVTGIPFNARAFDREDWPKHLTGLREPAVADLCAMDPSALRPGKIDARTGSASFAYIQAAIDAALARHVAAVTTAPIHKEALHLAGIPFPGHTEIFADRAGAERWCMMQYSEEITCTFVTVHAGYAEVPALLTTPRVLDVIELSVEGLRRILHRPPKVVVCGLNPHAGEHGLFGCGEEERLIQPAVEAARARGLDVEGPVPPDTAFLPEKRKTTDVFVCMYHDQGHIPVKALAFDSAVNTTLGLSLVRTSVDHGTALDIAWQGKARPGSLFAAIRLAVRLSAQETTADLLKPLA